MRISDIGADIRGVSTNTNSSIGNAHPIRKQDGSPGYRSSPEYGPAVREPQKTIEITPRREVEVEVGNGGPFCNVYTSGQSSMLTGGTVTGGDTNVAIPDINLGSVVNGKFFWIEANGNAVTEDGVLLPGFDLSTAPVGSGTTFPSSNTTPTANSEGGTIYISLGSWSNNQFIPAGCGNIFVFHCPGALTFSRG